MYVCGVCVSARLTVTRSCSSRARRHAPDEWTRRRRRRRWLGLSRRSLVAMRGGEAVPGVDRLLTAFGGRKGAMKRARGDERDGGGISRATTNRVRMGQTPRLDLS